MNKVFRNTLIFIALVSILNLLLTANFYMLIIILALGSLLSYINKNLLILLSASFIVVYLNDYYTVREDFVSATAAAIGGVIGGGATYFVLKKKTGKVKKVMTMPFRWGLKFKDKAFPSIVPNAAGIVNSIKLSQTTLLTNLITAGMGNVVPPPTAPIVK